MQIVCEFDFFNKLLINLKFSQNLRIVKTWSNFFLLLFLKLFAAHSLLETYVMRDGSDFSHTNCFKFLSSTKSWSFLNTSNINKYLLFEAIVFFCYVLLDFPICTEYVEDLFHEKKVLLLLVCFPLRIKS